MTTRQKLKRRKSNTPTREKVAQVYGIVSVRRRDHLCTERKHVPKVGVLDHPFGGSSLNAQCALYSCPDGQEKGKSLILLPPAAWRPALPGLRPLQSPDLWLKIWVT